MEIEKVNKMNATRAAIIEDKLSDRASLKILLEKHCPEILIIGEAANVYDGVELLRDRNPDIVFMDISLQPGSSFDILDELHKENQIAFDIVFITAHNTYENAVKAIQFSALAFLEKPIIAQELLSCVAKFEKKARDILNIQLSVLLEKTGAHFLQKQETIIIKQLKGVMQKVTINDIIYFEADKSICYVHLLSGDRLVSTLHLGHFVKTLADDDDFFLISQGVLLNLQHMRSYNHSSLTITLKNDMGKLNASRRMGAELKKFLKQNGK